MAQAQASLVKVPYIRYSPLGFDETHINTRTGFAYKNASYSI